MDLTRRQFVVISVAAALTGCQTASSQREELVANLARGPIDAGPVNAFAAAGVYGQFRDSGFFLVRDGTRVFAQSSICTHRACGLRARAGGFLCPCHGSTFTLAGHVTRGPAQRDLPRYRIELDARSHVIVHTDQTIWPDQFSAPGVFIET